jgi:DNA repair protein RecO (recombination protein O)
MPADIKEIVPGGKKMSLQKTSALVLKSIDWKDSSKITTLFTRELGKLNVMAKGAKKAGSRYRGILESLNLVEVFIYCSPHRELQTLGDISLEYAFRILRGNLLKTGYALSILELLDIFFAYGHPDNIFFDFNKQTLCNLENAGNEPVIFWYYLLKLASYLGFKPEFSRCRKCGKQVMDSEIFFALAEGSVICKSCLPAGEKGYALSKTDLDFLFRIQQTKNSGISRIENIQNKRFNFTDFLLQYIQFHTGQRLTLNGLKLSRSSQ